MTIQRMMVMFKVKLSNCASINLVYTSSILLKVCYI